MPRDVELRYTEAARAKLEEIKQRHVREIEYLIRRRKFVPGEGCIEVTPSDLEEAERLFLLTTEGRARGRYVVLYIYSAAGAFVFVLSLFYEQFKVLLGGSVHRLIVTLAGLFVALLSASAAAWLKSRDHRLELIFLEQQRRVAELLARKR